MGFIDRDSPIPAYYQIETDLKRRIAGGEWKSGEKMPSEKELADEYNISRVTLRQSLAELEKNGIIKKFRGKGAFICDIITPDTLKIDYKNFLHHRFLERGFPLFEKTLERGVYQKPYTDVKLALNIRSTESICYISSLLYYNNHKIGIREIWMPQKLVPELETIEIINDSLYETLFETYKLSPTKIDDTLTITKPSGSQRILLDAAYDTPLYQITSTIYTDNQPILYSKTFLISNQANFNFSFTSNLGNISLV